MCKITYIMYIHWLGAHFIAFIFLPQSCGDDGSSAVLNCVSIECTILGLEGRTGAQARVNVDGYLDERFFAVSFVQQNWIKSGDNSDDNSIFTDQC